MSFNVYFSIVLENKLYNCEWDPTKSEYTRGIKYNTPEGAIGYYNTLRGFCHGNYLHSLINNEKYFGFITQSIAGFHTVCYIEKWEDFDKNITKDIEHNGAHYTSEEELIYYLKNEVKKKKGPIPDDMYFFYHYLSDGELRFGYGRWDYDAKSIYRYKDICIFGEEPKKSFKPKQEKDDLPF